MRLKLFYRLILSLTFLFILACSDEKNNETNGEDTSSTDTGSDDTSDSENGTETNDTENGTSTEDHTSTDDDNQNPVSRFGGEITGGGTGTGFKTFPITIGDEHYTVQTNPWRNGTNQTLEIGNGKVFEVISMQEPDGLEDWDVATFPSVYRGVAHAGDNPSQDSGLPLQVSQLNSIPTGLSTNASSVFFHGNATYDVYFTNNENYTTGRPDVYIMVWLHAYRLNPINQADEAWNCQPDPPNYIESCTTAGSVTINGIEFIRFRGDSGQSYVVSYAPVDPLDTWEFDLKDFIDDSLEQGFITEQMYLQSIQAGFEIITGGAGLKVNDFYALIE